MSTEYGFRLRAARQRAGLTQGELSKRTGIPQSTISTAERLGNGSSETPVYAKACGVDAHWLATGDGAMDAVEATHTASSKVTHLPVVSLEAVMERLAYFLEQVSQADRGSSSAALAALALHPEDHVRKSAILRLLIEPSSQEMLGETAQVLK